MANQLILSVFQIYLRFSDHMSHEYKLFKVEIIIIFGYNCRCYIMDIFLSLSVKVEIMVVIINFLEASIEEKKSRAL